MKKVEDEKSPAEQLRSRKRWRKFALIYLNAVGVGCIIMGFRGWRMDRVPMQYVGYFLLAFGLAGGCGFNVWWSGPLDPRNDPTQEEIEEWMDDDELEN